VVDKGTIHLQKISIARDFGKEVEVRQGIKAGDRVVLNPTVDLTDGSKVAPQPEAASS